MPDFDSMGHNTIWRLPLLDDEEGGAFLVFFTEGNLFIRIDDYDFGFGAEEPLTEEKASELAEALRSWVNWRRKGTSCGHKLFGDGHCGEMSCHNYYMRCELRKDRHDG